MIFSSSDTLSPKFYYLKLLVIIECVQWCAQYCCLNDSLWGDLFKKLVVTDYMLPYYD